MSRPKQGASRPRSRKRKSYGRQVTVQRGQPEPESEMRGPEANLHTDVHCLKNPGHTDFVPVRKFTKFHLPDKYQNQDVLKYIRAAAELNVHLRAEVVSRDRPEKWFDTPYGYPCKKFGGRKFPRSGSGFIFGVVKCGEGSEHCQDEKCMCVTCKRSKENAKKTWWKVYVLTVAHVTFDLKEVKGTEVRFFYDENGSASKEANVWKGMDVLDRNTEEDWCRFVVPVHNEMLVRRIEKAWRCLGNLELKLHTKPVFGDLTIAVSHPHGCPKHISVGKFLDEIRSVDWLKRKPVIHDASTCPGSSGGLVIVGRARHGRFCSSYSHSEGLSEGRARTAGIWGWWALE